MAGGFGPRLTWLRFFALVAFSLSPQAAQAFDCQKKYCREMSSCAEARYQYSVCGYTNLDRDKDGIPCEVVCGSGKRAPKSAPRPKVDKVDKADSGDVTNGAPSGSASRRD